LDLNQLPFSSLSAAAAGAPARPSTALTAAERVLEAELRGRGGANDALSMMVSSVARMVQVGKSCDSRWKST
jgi:hypothetical protein